MHKDRLAGRVRGGLQKLHHVRFLRVPRVKANGDMRQRCSLHQRLVVVQAAQSDDRFHSHLLKLEHALMGRLRAAKQCVGDLMKIGQARFFERCRPGRRTLTGRKLGCLVRSGPGLME